jgi:hypothetical protein
LARFGNGERQESVREMPGLWPDWQAISFQVSADDNFLDLIRAVENLKRLRIAHQSLDGIVPG